ncbi:MAG TPA: hypothetical protein VGN72_01045 [Tepidisphaeraceae bacterium]|nr:hypothetical protein [Tepidisphaeraceae bacterium]
MSHGELPFGGLGQRGSTNGCTATVGREIHTSDSRGDRGPSQVLIPRRREVVQDGCEGPDRPMCSDGRLTYLLVGHRQPVRRLELLA